MATDQLTLTVTCPECDARLPMLTGTHHTGQGTAEVTVDTSTVRNHLADHQPKPEPKTPAPGEQIISDPDTWPSIRDDEQRHAQLLTWLRANGINPNDIPVDSTVNIEPATEGGHLIRHTVYLRDTTGRHYVEPGQDHAAQEEHTVPLTVPLPDGWPQPVAPVKETTPLATCRAMETRTCPPSYNGPCGDRPCARFESDDETPWAPTGRPADLD